MSKGFSINDILGNTKHEPLHWLHAGARSGIWKWQP